MWSKVEIYRWELWFLTLREAEWNAAQWIQDFMKKTSFIVWECVVNKVGLTVPSPPQARILRLGTLLYSSNLQEAQSKLAETEASPKPDLQRTGRTGRSGRTGEDRLGVFNEDLVGGQRRSYPSLGPPFVRSNTCRGFRYHMKDWMIFAPWERKNKINWGKMFHFTLWASVMDVISLSLLARSS